MWVSSEEQTRTINCNACGLKHKLTLNTTYTVSFFDMQFGGSEEQERMNELFTERQVKYILAYECPVKNLGMQVTLTFASSDANKFENANVTEVQVI